MNRAGAVLAHRPRILVFCRPYLVRDFRANVEPLADQFHFEFLTDGRAKGTRDTRATFYAALRSGKPCGEIDAATETDIVTRCRLLRNLPAERARGLVHAMAHCMLEELNRCSPDAVLCHMVDEYVTHVLASIAQKHGISFVGYAHSYFPGLIQLTRYAYGEPFDVREPSDPEVEAVLGQINQRVYRQNYQQRDNYTLWRHLRGLVRYRAKRLVFAAKALMERDPWHVHYAITPYIVERRRLRDFPRPGDFAIQWKEELERLKLQTGRQVVYLPLAYFPESTIDYWVRDTRILDYEQITLEMIHILAQRYIVIVKEHVHMMGARAAAFYRSLRAVPGVVSVHPLEYSNDVLAASDVVVLGGGSVGVEATIRGKPVLTYCDTSYWFEQSKAAALPLDDLRSWPGRVSALLESHRALAEQEISGFLRACMRSTVRPREGGIRWPLVDISDLRNLLTAAAARPTNA